MSKMFITSVLVTFLCFIAPANANQGQLYLVKESKPAATIVIPKESGKWTKTAAKWLSEYISKATDAKLSIVSEDTNPSGTLISVGHTKLAEKAGVNVSGLKWDGCKLVVKGNTLFLLGRDQKPVGSGWTGGAARGTCKAVTTLLEDIVGVRWLLPVREGEFIPKRDNIAVPTDLDKTVTPAFAFIHGRYPYGYNTPGAIANNYRTAIKLLSHGGHAYYDWLPAKKYFKTHPEYFALIDGKRTGKGNHLCSSNPQVRKILLRGIQKEFDNGYDWVALGQSDGYRPCECPECEKMDKYRKVMGPSVTAIRKDKGEKTWGDYLRRFKTVPCEQLMSMHRWIVDECAKSHPDKKVHMLIYWPSLIPGKAFATKSDNLVGEVAFYNDPYELEVMDMWKDKVHGLSVMVTWFDLTTGKGTYGVMMTPQEVSERMRVYYQKNVIGMYGIHEANWGLQGACYYVMGKMAGNPDLDWKDLMDEYCQGLYGKAGKAMRSFFDLLYTRSICKLGYQWQVKTFGSAADKHLLLYDVNFLRRLESLLEKAEALAKTDGEDGEMVEKLVALTRLQIDYLKIVTQALNAHKAYNARKSRKNLRRLEQTVNDFQEFRYKVLTYDAEYVQAWPAHDWFCRFLVGDGTEVNYYISWAKRKKQLDMKNLRKIAPGFSGCVMRKPFTLDFTKLR